MKFQITAFTADLFNSFCEEVYVVAFSKVSDNKLYVKCEIQLHVCGQIIYVCNSDRIIKIGQYLRKLCSNEKGSTFFLTHIVYVNLYILQIKHAIKPSTKPLIHHAYRLKVYSGQKNELAKTILAV